ncbi:MAG: hypothetical protein FWE59_06740 [Oscillospiraceae bacterium]|nr:hypothetical protein [Oscillospiraceae bacterium]
MHDKAADRYFAEHMNDHAISPTKKWQDEYGELTGERIKLYSDYAVPNGEVKEVEPIRWCLRYHAVGTAGTATAAAKCVG